MTKKQIALNAVNALKEEYPEAICSLVYTDPLQLLIATRLAAQCTDARVNMVTPALFERFKTVDDFAESTADEVAEYIKKKCAELSVAEPRISMEPGRSIVADAGLTLYRVGSVKRIEGYKNYVAIDGGMTDNPRYALYKSQYTVLAADKAEEPCTFPCDLVGKCCESGDIIQPKIMLPESVERGDLIAVLTTGAYNFSMSSNYNRVPKLPVVMVNGDEDYIAVKGETLDDIIRNDM